MAGQRRRCRWHGFGYVGKTGRLMCVCERTGEQVQQSYCHQKCEDYSPLPKKRKDDET